MHGGSRRRTTAFRLYERGLGVYRSRRQAGARRSDAASEGRGCDDGSTEFKVPGAQRRSGAALQREREPPRGATTWTPRRTPHPHGRRGEGGVPVDRAGRRGEHHLRHVPPAAGELDLRRCGARLLVGGRPVGAHSLPQLAPVQRQARRPHAVGPPLEQLVARHAPAEVVAGRGDVAVQAQVHAEGQFPHGASLPPLGPSAYAVASSPSAASTSSSCVLGDAFGITWRTTPSSSMRNVARRLPQYVRPYIDFSAQTPYASATAWSSSASRVKFMSNLSWNFLTFLTGSGETPSTTALAAS